MNTPTKSQTLTQLMLLQARLHKRLNGYLSFQGISFTEYLVLQELSQAPGHKMRRIDLADKIGLTASGVTRLLNPMEKIGLVEKESAARDARVSLVSLSKAGQRVLKDAESAIGQAAEKTFSPLNEATLLTFAEAISQMAL